MDSADDPGAHAIAERLAAGDRDTIAWLYDTLAPGLYRRLLRRYGYPGGPDAADVLQETFLLCLRDEARLLRGTLAGRPAGSPALPPLRQYLWDLACGVAANARRSVWSRRFAGRVSAAAALAASIVLVLLTLFPLQRELPAGLAYDMSARGLAEVRSPEEAPGQVGAGLRAYPGTPLRILVRPRGDSPAGLSFALFRREGGALRRVREAEEVRLASDRGSAAFEGAAGSVLAARAPGVYPLYVARSPAWTPACRAAPAAGGREARRRATCSSIYPTRGACPPR